jgi:hypothetical protein
MDFYGIEQLINGVWKEVTSVPGQVVRDLEMSTYMRKDAHVLQAATILLQFLAQLLMGIVAAILYALPWLFRAVSIVVWFASLFVCIQTIDVIYAPFSDDIPLFALQFGVVMLMVVWTMVGMMDGRQVWGILTAGAVVLGMVTQGAVWLSTHWVHADLFFRVLPSALLAVGMITLSLRMRTRRLVQISIKTQTRGATT